MVLFIISNRYSAYHSGFEGWINLSPLQRLPVDRLKEDVFSDVPHNSQPACGVSLKQLQRNIVGLL